MRRALTLGASVSALALLAAGCGGGGSHSGAPSAGPAFRAASIAEVRTAVMSRLRRKHLPYHWVACVGTGRRYRGIGVIRCNVNFGDPHIVAYCTVLRGDVAVTQVENPAIPCGPDRAGWNATSVTG